MKRVFVLSVYLAMGACSTNQDAPGIEVKDVDVAALFTVPPDGVSCIRITASSPKRTATSDFGVTAGGGTASLSMHGVPTGEVVFSGAAYPDQCGFIFSGSTVSWVSDPVTTTVTPGGFTSITLKFHGVATVSAGVDFGDESPYTVSTIAGNGTQGSADGFGTAARFEGPNGIALDGDNLYIVDRNIDNTGTVFPFIGMTIRRLTISTGQVTTLAGDPNAIGTNDGPGNVARFSRLRGIAFSAGLLYVVDACAVRTISTSPPFTVTTLIGKPRPPPNQASFQCGVPLSTLFDIAVRPSGIYVVDEGRLTVDKIDLSTSPPTITTVAGVPDVSGSEDGTVTALSPGHFLLPAGIAFPFPSVDEIFYVADSGNAADTFYGLIRRVSIFEDALTTVAGAAHTDSAIRDGIGPAALFSGSRRLASDGNSLFIGDQTAVRRMDLASFAVTTLAGGSTAGFRDGQGRSALLSVANGIALAPDRKIYIADQGNFAIRVLTP
jgi:hypothetical protein